MSRQAWSTGDGEVRRRPGTYTVSDVIAGDGDDTDDGSTIILSGAGMPSVTLVSPIDVNVIGAPATPVPVVLRDVAIAVTGSGSGIGISPPDGVGQARVGG